MSLINQMLKDLDARRGDGGAASPFGGQVRAVAFRRSIHPGWWVALGVALSASVAAAWLLLRPVPQLHAPGVAPGQTEPGRPRHADATSAEPVLTKSEPAASVIAPMREPAHEPHRAGVMQLPVEQAARPEIRRGQDFPAPAPVAATKSVLAPPIAVPDGTVNPGTSLLASAAALPAARRPAADPVEAGSVSLVQKQVVELSPAQRAEHEFRQASALLRQGRHGDALSGFEQALAFDPQHHSARQARVALLLDAKRAEDAIRLLGEGLDIDVSQTGFAMILARLQLEQGDLRSAIETMDRSRMHAGARADYIAFHAGLLQRAERHAEAAEQYLQALQRAPQNGVWWMGLGISLQAERRSAEALDAYHRAKATNSLSPELLAFVDSRVAQLK